tara:strand:- start:81 stop:284 length:204 start_codon:yes stop_codon:yes gene_type:complete
MCIGNFKEIYDTKIKKNRNASPLISGSQIGVNNPIDTKKATEQLKINRQSKDKPLKLRGRSPFDLRL